jgi:hypothetical protein
VTEGNDNDREANLCNPFDGAAVQRKKAVELQQAWGDKPCTHPAFSREYDLGERTGNYCCTQCGASVTFREKAELTEARGADPRRARER